MDTRTSTDRGCNSRFSPGRENHGSCCPARASALCAPRSGTLCATRPGARRPSALCATRPAARRPACIPPSQDLRTGPAAQPRLPAPGIGILLLVLLLTFLERTGWGAQKKAVRPPPPAASARPAPTAPTLATAADPADSPPDDPTPGVSAEGLEDRVREMLAAGRLEEAGAEIDRGLAGLPDPGPLRARLAALLAATAQPLLAAAPAADWPASAAAPLEGAWRKARDLDPDQVSYWLSYLDCLARQPGTEAALTFEGQDLLDRHGAALRRQPPAGQIPLLQRLGEIFDQRGFPLHRLEILQILARHPATASEANRLLPMARETVKLRSAELLERIEAAMVMNELDQAKNLLERLRAAQPDLPQLARLATRLDTVRKVQSLLTEASIALQRRDTAQVKRLCDQTLELDPNNPNARAYLAQIAAPAASATAPTTRVADPRAARQADLLARLARAGQDEDLAESRRLLKELIAQGFAREEHFRQLSAIDKELAQGRLFAPERFEDARRLMAAGKWAELHRFLNRNPALGDSLERIMAVWDMRLAAAFFTAAKDDEALLADADRIATKNPKSFWSPFVRMRIALRRNEMAEAEKQLGLARAISPDHKLLTWWGRLLWVWRHGWKIVPLVLLAFFYVAAKGMFWFLHLWENGYWTRTAWIGRVLPRLALASLERRFGTVKEDWARQRMFELLTQYAFACGEKEKGIRYAELLLEMKAQHPLAMQLLGRHYLSAPLKPPQTGFLLTYLKLFPDDKDALAKVGRFLLASNQLTGDHLDLARRYMNAFPQDQDMVVAVGQMLDGTDVLSVTGETLEIMEKAWRVSNRDALWWSLWRALVVKGSHDRALTLLAEALQAGRPIDPVQLPDVLESQLDPVVMTLQRDITGLDKAAAAAALARLANLKFLTARQADLLLPYLDGSVNDDDPGVRYAAQKARDHVQKAAEKTAEFVSRLRAVPPSATAPSAPT
ncbi:MAG: hypothetical protein GX442_14040, partial [Candidatus Riflebacteria bacterium]|nr:hypothetical protein [Candidatus Riflebacteria bacterium]